MNRLILVIAALVHANAFAQAQQQERGPLGKCTKPKAPLYRQQDANDALEVTLMADHGHIHGARMNRINWSIESRSGKGVIGVKRAGEGAPDYMPVMLKTRGKSRGAGCAVKPLRIVFLDQKIEREIEAALETKGIAAGSPGYLPEYYKMLDARPLGESEINVSQDNNIFDKLGDDVKFVTHCGMDEGGFVGADTAQEQDTRLLSEYYLYKLLEELNTPVETARLVKITYLTPAGVAVFPGVGGTTTRLGFFREPPRAVAKRCGLLTKPPAGAQSRTIDEESGFQTQFINMFLHNRDSHFAYDFGHNTNIFYVQSGVSHPAPYDFDLAGVFYNKDNYNGATLEENRARLIAWLQEQPKARAIPMVERAVAKRAAMTAILQNALVEQQRKTTMLNWLNSYMDALEQFLKDWR